MTVDKAWAVGLLSGAAVFIIQLLATLFITHFVNKRLKERDEKQDRKEKARVDYESVSLEVNVASAKLSYAIAMAWKRGQPNGEVEAGIAAYNEAMDKLQAFIRNQALYSIK